MASPEQSARPAAAAPIDTIIHRKAQAGLAEHQARAMSLAKALRLTFAKVADKMFDLSMGVIAVRREVRTAEDIAEALQQDGLRMVFDGPDRQRAGIIIDGNLVAALIQQQTMGKVLPDTSNSPRPLTATDAAVCSPFLEAVLKQAALMPESPEDSAVISGYRFGVFAENARLMGMALDAQDYDLVHIDLDIAGGVRQGHVLLCMPQKELAAPSASASLDTVADEETVHSGQGTVAPLLSETVLNLNAEVRISLATCKMSLRRLGELKEGSVLELGNVSFDRVAVQTLAGQTVARGILGQLDGQRAVQVQPARKGPMPVFEADTPPKPQTTGLLDDGSAAVDEYVQTDVLGGLKESGMIEVSDLPEIPDLPDLPDLPELPELDGFDTLPDLPDLSDT